jgi:hypothetical protein
MVHRCLLAAAAFIFSISTAQASTIYLEDFEAPFPAWESGWLGTNSNLQNYYGVGGARGNNPDGLWLDDGDGIRSSTEVVTISLAPTFGATLVSFAIDVAAHTLATLRVFDSSNNTLLQTDVTPTFGASGNPANYAHYEVPEPATVMLIGSGLLAIARRTGRKVRRSASPELR